MIQLGRVRPNAETVHAIIRTRPLDSCRREFSTNALVVRARIPYQTQAASKLRESDARLESLDLEFGKMRTQLHDLVATKQHLKESLQVRHGRNANLQRAPCLVCNLRRGACRLETRRSAAMCGPVPRD